jgi:endoglucanase
VNSGFRKDGMTNKTELQARREFLKLAALTGAAALAGNGPAGLAEGTREAQAAHQKAGEGSMEFLHASGRQILDAQGKKVRLRGTCPGGWMNMEDFINGHPGAEHTLRAQMAEVLGPSKAQFFFDRLLDHFFNEDDVVFLKKAGASVVRFPLNYRHFEDDAAPFHYKEAGFLRDPRSPFGAGMAECALAL